MTDTAWLQFQYPTTTDNHVFNPFVLSPLSTHCIPPQSRRHVSTSNVDSPTPMERGESSKRPSKNSIYGVLPSGPLEHITSRTEILTNGRIARSLPKLRPPIEEKGTLSFSSPCLLQAESPQEWSDLHNEPVSNYPQQTYPRKYMPLPIFFSLRRYPLQKRTQT